MRILVCFAVPFAVSSFFYSYFFSPLFGVAAAVLFFTAFSVLCFIKSGHLSKWRIVAIGLAFGFLWNAAYEQFVMNPVLKYSGTETDISATVYSYPVQTSYGCRIKASADMDGRKINLLCYLKEKEPDLQPGDKIAFFALLRRADKTSDDETVNYNLAEGIHLTATARGSVSVQKEAARSFVYFPALFAQRVRGAVEKCMDEETGGFVQALITGDKSSLNSSDKAALNAAGVSHVIAVSGMHVSILLGILYFVLRGRKILCIAIGFPVLFFFVLMTGMSPSVVRAAIMYAFVMMAPVLKRENDTPSSLCAAMLLILFVNPRAITGASFQLSFSAAAGIISVSPGLLRRINAVPPIKKAMSVRGLRSVLKFLISVFSSTVGALIFTVPVTAAVFGTFSVYALLTNILVLWVIGVCFCGGLLVGILGLMSISAGKMIGFCLSIPVRYVLSVCRFVSALPFSVLRAGNPYVTAWMFFLYILAGIVFFFRKKYKLLPFAFLSAGIGFAACLLFLFLERTPDSFQISVLDVGQGQCVCFLTEDCSVMFDCGGSDAVDAGNTAASCLKEAGLFSLDYLVLSHYDNDHVGGVFQLMNNCRIGTIFMPDCSDDSGVRDAIEEAASSNGIPVIPLSSDYTITFSNGSIEVFGPVTSIGGNNSSLSALCDVCGYKMLITGDMDTDTERKLLALHSIPEVDLYVAGHHGSNNSSGTALLQRIKPKTVVISVGYNRYGHPSEQTIQRFLSVNASVYRTDECGEISIGK